MPRRVRAAAIAAALATAVATVLITALVTPASAVEGRDCTDPGAACDPLAQHVVVATTPATPPPPPTDGPDTPPPPPPTGPSPAAAPAPPPAPAGDRDCADFPTQAAAQAALSTGPASGLLIDADGDGVACAEHFGTAGRQVAVHPVGGVATRGTPAR